MQTPDIPAMPAESPTLPKITVITPSFNQGQFLEQTIRSVLDQDYPNLEYLLLDGGSSDGTLKILESYRDRLWYTSQPDRGQTHAINKGLALASGEIVCFLNSDDQFAPGALAKAGAHFAAHPECAWLSGRCRIVDQGGLETLKPITAYKNFWLAFHSPSVLGVLNYISQPATFWRRTLLERVGYFNEELHYAFDYEYWLRILQVEKLCVLPEVLALFRVHAASKGSTGVTAQFDEEMAIARRLVSSPGLLRLHAWHNALILRVYSRIQARSAGG